jgi:hypothetical protein
MVDKTIPAWREHVYQNLQRYWPQNIEQIYQIPTPYRELPDEEDLPPVFAEIRLPEWASDIAIKQKFLVPKWAELDANGQWEQVDWIAVAFWYMENLAERAFEEKHGPIHSYSFRLRGWDPRLWRHAWVNRIALFLRRWAAQAGNSEEVNLLGPLPKAEIRLTHDVDAVTKTGAIRLKQAAFNAFNCMRSLGRLQIHRFFESLAKACRFLGSTDDYWCFEQIRKMEREQGRSSTFNFYAGKPGPQRTPRERLMDPAYDIHEHRLREELATLRNGGWEVGLHPSYDAWADKQRFLAEKQNLERATGADVTTCRQHWLRFSFEKTWQMQAACKIVEDTTLGFNDRPGFRNSAALTWHPWDPARKQPMGIKATPMVLMDSHLYDYKPLSTRGRTREIAKWLYEVKSVGGQVTVIWHQRVFSQDYGWRSGYAQLLSCLPTT